MENKIDIKAINRLIYISITIILTCLIFAVTKYIGVSALIGKILRSFIPVILAIFISFIIEPLVGALIKRKIKRKYSVLIIYSLLIIIIGILIYLIVPPLLNQIEVFINSIPSLLNIIQKFLNSLGLDLGNNIEQFLSSVLINFSTGIIDYLGSSLSIIFDILLAVSGALFLSFDFPKFRKVIKTHLPNKIKTPVIYYFQHFLPFVHKYFLGMLIDSILIFIISVIGFSFIGIKYPLVISLFIALTNLIPIIGPYVGGVPAAIVGFSVSSSLGISAIIVVIIIQIIESNFMQPLILKNVISLHPLEGILGISLFGALFGVIGMILSPILIVSIKLLFIPYNEKNIIEENT